MRPPSKALNSLWTVDRVNFSLKLVDLFSIIDHKNNSPTFYVREHLIVLLNGIGFNAIHDIELPSLTPQNQRLIIAQKR